MALAAIVLLAGVGYGRLLEPGRVPFSQHSDLIAHHLGEFANLHASLERGEGMPLWRSDIFAGTSAVTNPHSRFTNPLNLPFWWLPSDAAAGPALWLDLVVLAAGTYLLGVVLGLRLMACLWMALAALLSFRSALVVYAGWLPHLTALACLPWLAAGYLAFAQRPRGATLLGLAAAGAFALHAGHLQYVYYLGLFLTAHAAWELARRGRRGGAWRFAAGLCLAAALAIGASAYLLLPLAAEASLLTRADFSYEQFLCGHGLEPRHLATLLRPEALGSPLDGSYPGLWDDSAYLGVLTLLLLVPGLAWGARSGPKLFFGASVVACFALAFDSPLLRFVYSVVPGFGLFRCPTRLLYVAALFSLALAGIGMHELLERARRRQPRWAIALALALVAVVVAEGLSYTRRYVLTVPATLGAARPAFAEVLAAEPVPFRVAPVGRGTLNYGWAGHLGLELVTGYDSYIYRHYFDYFDLMTLRPGEVRVDPTFADVARVERWDLLDVLNVRFLLSRAAVPGAPLVRRGAWPNQPLYFPYRGFGRGWVVLSENPTALERAFVAPSVLAVGSEAEAAEVIAQRDLRQVAVVQVEAAHLDAGEGEVRILDYRPGSLELQTRCEGGCFVVVSEVWHPGWHVSRDDEELPVHRTNLALLGIQVPAGEQTLRVHFEPPGWRMGLGVAATSIVVWLVAAAWLVARQRSPRRVRG